MRGAVAWTLLTWACWFAKSSYVLDALHSALRNNMDSTKHMAYAARAGLRGIQHLTPLAHCRSENLLQVCILPRLWHHMKVHLPPLNLA